MKIALIDPYIKGHNLRGIGIYANNLYHSLQNLYPNQIVRTSSDNLPQNVDLYHFPYFDPFFLTIPFLRHKPTVITIHDLIPIRFPDKFPRGIKGELKWQIQKLLAKSTKAIITDSHSSKEDVIRYMGINSNKIHPIYLAADKIFFNKTSENIKNNLRIKLKLPDHFGLFVGDVNWNKNLINTIKAVKQINFPLVIVSRAFNKQQISLNNPWLKDFVKAKQYINSSELITLLNDISQSDLVTLYQLARVFLYPSRYEGFGLPVLEAYASGCPVITTDKGSLKEITGDGALIVDPESPNEISTAIKKIINNTLLTEKLTSKARAQVNNFSWDKTAKETYAIYLQVSSKTE